MTSEIDDGGAVKPCEFCTDGNPDESEARCVYPYFGLAPHRHDMTITGSIIGSTVTLMEPPTGWPANFKPEYEEGDDRTKPIPGLCGVYTHCLKCGAPDRTPAPSGEGGGK